MKRSLLAAVVLGIAFVVPPPAAAQADRPTLTPEGCAIAADMSLMARSLAAEKVDRAQASRVMALAYAGYVKDIDARVREELISFAYARTEIPSEFAVAVYQTCVQARGNLAPLLGTPSYWRPPARGARSNLQV